MGIEALGAPPLPTLKGCKSGYDQDQRHAYPPVSARAPASRDVADVDPVYDVIKHVD